MKCHKIILKSVSAGVLLVTMLGVQASAFEVTRVYGGSGAAVLTHSEELWKLQQQNPEVTGWLSVPSTNIEYPLVKNSSHSCEAHGVADNCWYTNRDVLGKSVGRFDNSGSVFIDSRNGKLDRKNLDRNVIIYGHNWTNIQSGDGKARIAGAGDKMFAQLPSLSDNTVASGIPWFSVETPTDSFVYLIFSVAYVDTYDSKTNPQGFYYLDVNPKDNEFGALLKELQSRSVHNYKIPVGLGDKLAILSTCSYKNQRDGNGRLIVAGRLLRQGETAYDHDPPSIK